MVLPRPLNRIPLWILSLAIFPLGFGGLLQCGRDAWKGLESRHWAVVEGTILSSDVSTGLFGIPQPAIRYSYTFANQQKVSTRIWPGEILGVLPLLPNESRHIVATFQRGKPMQVHIDPLHPNQSALIPGPRRALSWLALFASILGVGIWAPLALGKFLRRGESDVSL